MKFEMIPFSYLIMKDPNYFDLSLLIFNMPETLEYICETI